MTLRKRLLVFALVTACFGALLSCGYGQADAPEEPPAAEQEQAAQSATSLIGLLKQGGLLMWPLGFLSVATIALAVYGFMIVRPTKMLTPELVPSLQESVSQLRLDEAVNICNGTPSLLTNILNAGLQRISDGILDVPSMEKAMEEASVEETSSGLKIISYLSIIAQIAPMLGLLGTVSGMIKAFQKIGQGGMGKPEVLAGNIGEAMVTTATGLLIGIPAMFLYFYLKNRYTSNVTKLGRVLGNLSHQLVAASRRAEENGTPIPVPVTETAEDKEEADEYSKKPDTGT